MYPTSSRRQSFVNQCCVQVDGERASEKPVEAARSNHSHRSIEPKGSNAVGARQASALAQAESGHTSAHLLKVSAAAIDQDACCINVSLKLKALSGRAWF
jgi:hypothetical protein